jgi:hypothetical protein
MQDVSGMMHLPHFRHRREIHAPVRQKQPQETTHDDNNNIDRNINSVVLQKHSVHQVQPVHAVFRSAQ